ncbi:MAG: tRNA guanosine(34) transglycosylase Tgt [Oscillospiraceae bacterium]|jgi:queuine tRNA-ribosyltransferase|nr:tRNA guanosine(34) transglycosylase Tgt [Oscillospiraceae bacterium]
MYTLLKTEGLARRGRVITPHGTLETPVFMNVATQAAIKGGLSALDLKAAGCQIALCNTYHLHLRPGEDTVRKLGGLHGFMGWDAPMLTDSGGFQVFSLSRLRKISEEGVSFASHLDGRRIFLSPEGAVEIQRKLGADIIMALDECVENPAPYEYVKQSAERTARWLERTAKAVKNLRADGDGRPDSACWGINQGGTYDDLRTDHMKRIAELDMPGYAVGGLAVGEETAMMYHILDAVGEHMPPGKPRYLMGVGTPENIIEAVARGIDFFDCVMPARNARHGRLYTWEGRINILNERYKEDGAPVDPSCRCPLCANHSRAYLRHLFKAGEVLALRLAVLHNLTFYNTLTVKIREAIETNTFAAFRKRYTGVLDGKALS